MNYKLPQHPLVLWLCLLGVTIGLAALGMGLLILAPNSIGQIREDYAINSAFAFDDWSISTRSGRLHFPEGGLAVEAYEHNKLAAFVIYGKAIFTLDVPEKTQVQLDDIHISTVFLAEKELLCARGSTVIRAAESSEAYLDAASLLQNERKYLPTLEVLGSQRSYPFQSGVARFALFDNAGQKVVFRDSLQVSLQGLGIDESFASASGYRLHPPLTDTALAITFYLACIILLLIASYFATLGWETSARLQSFFQSSSKGGLAVLISLALVYALGTGIVMRYELSVFVKLMLDVLLVSLLAYRLHQANPTRLVPTKAMFKSLLPYCGVGLALGILAVCLGQLALPGKFALLSGQDYATIIGGGIITVIAQTLLWRWAILGQVVNSYGNIKGLLITAGLQGLSAGLIWLCYPSSTLGPINTLILVPALSVWLGYTYLRTNRLTMPLIISACMAILPQIIVFK